MKKAVTWIWLVWLGLGCAGPGDPPASGGEDASNPFSRSFAPTKEDTGYLNPQGVELEVTLEASVPWDLPDKLYAPAQLAQFAMTSLRKTNYLYLEMVTEDVLALNRVEWLVDDRWLPHSAAQKLNPLALSRFRIRAVTAAALKSDAERVQPGSGFHAFVPWNPNLNVAEIQTSCADPEPTLALDGSTYWYTWNPFKLGCKVPTQLMTVTVDELLPAPRATYPEYDRLWADSELRVAAFFGRSGKEDTIASNSSWQTVDRFVRWLESVGFERDRADRLGLRLRKQQGRRQVVVDVYGPDVFHDLTDFDRFAHWQQAIYQHEVIFYSGHSVLGSGFAFEQVRYPDFYQIFLVASCLSYEYYVQPILAGKGSWSAADVLTSVEPTSFEEALPLTSTVLAGLVWGFEHEGALSWQGILGAVQRQLAHPYIGASGVRGNRFQPGMDESLGAEPERPHHLYGTYPSNPSSGFPCYE